MDKKSSIFNGDWYILNESKMPKIIIPAGKEPSRVEYPDGKIDLNRDSIDYWKINNKSQWESQ
ncbi:hypothetical protein XNC1_3155 [Xenorhabdus nematophila ATCC 19061]|uniref:Uncharacterized protein n=1 Tax=Xenorhabdus nematophila (strain ATCC 19061 / DSM 3370 / CCUG 14189 / LMG 1036 / NCIMB 9965 / AN6) TaxID=406817 RepID=D3VKU9_XENNA|nr:hypothetical protein [Xenorhabdus nematophila]CBJ91207.1 hypothetical protein XNC1_3155 [Xenorhabdus nematophila ATCC 19061]CEF28527.1 hypothetical protein XNW1_1150002 [Xenorhabdus nematophila str. Websteri]AYA39766.1 hypothetical protein D3790_04140 [Xenorhabdus nematophila]MCB4424921.1 hypothetical protein [Xenorhabdus nematophila]CEF30467.1 hypothetical protein XNW1_2590002 [Xenorhabdus nematophila str. Websteri]